MRQIEAIQGPLPDIGPWDAPRRPGQHVIRHETAAQMNRPHAVLRRVWQQVRVGKAFPRLQGEDITQQQALRIAVLVRYMREEDQQAEVERLAQMPLGQLKRLKPEQRARLAPRRKPTHHARPVGQRWRQELVEIHQHILALERGGLIKQLARSWTPDVQRGYHGQLGQLLEKLQLFRSLIGEVIEEDANPPVLSLPKARARR